MERVNKEVMRHMKNIIFDKRVKKHWSDYYPFVERIINAQIHSVIKLPPSKIIYGNTIDLDRAILKQGDEPNPFRHIKKIQLSE